MGKAESLFNHKEKSSTVDYIIEEIKRLLETGKLKPGDKIPSETEIAEELGVSRGSVRSAMVVFKSFGIVDIRPGDGTYICTKLNKNSMNAMIFSLMILNPNFNEITQFREKLELDILDLIIKDESLRIKTVKEMEGNLKELEFIQNNPESTIEDYSENERDFHLIMARNCNNVVFEAIYRYVFEYFYPYIKKTHMKQISGQHAATEHKRICEAIKNKDYSNVKAAVQNSMQVWYALNLQ